MVGITINVTYHFFCLPSNFVDFVAFNRMNKQKTQMFLNEQGVWLFSMYNIYAFKIQMEIKSILLGY